MGHNSIVLLVGRQSNKNFQSMYYHGLSAFLHSINTEYVALLCHSMVSLETNSYAKNMP